MMIQNFLGDALSTLDTTYFESTVSEVTASWPPAHSEFLPLVLGNLLSVEGQDQLENVRQQCLEAFLQDRFSALCKAL